MEKFLSIFERTALFQQVPKTDILLLLHDMQARLQRYTKGNFIFFTGDHIRHVGIVLSGAAHIVQEDYWGNRNIVAHLTPSQMFGEAFACQPDMATTVSVVSTDVTEVLFIDVFRIWRCRSRAAVSQERVMMNLLAILARKNMFLTRKIHYLSQRSMRKKLMFYLSEEATRQGAAHFSLPFNRQELADFLAVDRSALSSELSKMKKEGLIDYYKRDFVLKSSLPAE